MNGEVFNRPSAGKPRGMTGPTAEPFLYRWSDAELEALKRGANAQLVRTREVWSATNEDAERDRLNRRISSLADLVLKINHLQLERAKATREAEKPPESPA